MVFTNGNGNEIRERSIEKLLYYIDIFGSPIELMIEI